MFSSIRSRLKPYDPQILAFIFLGYAPFLGESFRFYVLPCSGFILLGLFFTLWHLSEFKQFFREKSPIVYAWLLIMLYCIINTIMHWGQYPLYGTYLDLGPIFVMLFGLFLASYLSTRISLGQLLAVLIIILALLFCKTMYALIFKVAIPADGVGFFIGGAGYGVWPRIILRGENPFLISIFMFILGLLVLRKKSLLNNLGLMLVLITTTVIIALSGWRSIYFALFISSVLLVILACLIAPMSKKSLNKLLLLGIFITLLFSSVFLLVGRDANNPAIVSSLTSSPGMEGLANNEIPILNSAVVQKMSSNQIPLLNSQSVVLKMAEYLDVIEQVSDHGLVGLGMGSSYFSPGPASVGNYVHSQLFWLYFKGGLILVALFYGFMLLVLVSKFRHWLMNPDDLATPDLQKKTQNLGIILSALIVIALGTMDALTNQFPTLAGSFYLGFWVNWANKMRNTDNLS